MPHNLTAAKMCQNAAFLRELETTGNVRLAADRAGLSRRTVQRRRAAHGVFRQQWDAALAFAQARLTRKADGGQENAAPTSRPATQQASDQGRRTTGGEATLVRRRDGTLQVRRAHPGKLTQAAEQCFLLALAATCNVRLAAAAAGCQSTHFYARRRRDTAFAREWRQALEEGYARLELACLEAALPEAHVHDGWSHNERPALPPMTPGHALQLLYLHQKEARLDAEPRHIRRRHGESTDTYSFRMAAMSEARHERERDKFRIAEAARHARGEKTVQPWEPPVVLPDLAQVTGWSKAGEGQVHDPDVALFGGWRIGDMLGRGGGNT